MVVTIPPAALVGAYYLTACADDGETVEEGREDSNCRASATTGPSEESTSAASVTMPVGVGAGTYYLIVCADGEKSVLESDENDNCGASVTRMTVTDR